MKKLIARATRCLGLYKTLYKVNILVWKKNGVLPVYSVKTGKWLMNIFKPNDQGNMRNYDIDVLCFLITYFYYGLILYLVNDFKWGLHVLYH